MPSRIAALDVPERASREILLDVKELVAGYGTAAILQGVNLCVREGELVTLLGRNGMGKTTTVNTIMGNVRARAGTIRYLGHAIERLDSHSIAQAGIGIVPEGRRIFPNLTVRENLVVGASNRSSARDPWTLDRVLDIFPNLKRRTGHWGTQLSGGEQQMLAVGRALMMNPRLLILDEATEGLAPLVREEIWRCLALLKGLGQSILVIDKNVDRLARLADHHYVLEKGQSKWNGSSDALRTDLTMRSRYLTV